MKTAMRVKELKEMLAQYDDDMVVELSASCNVDYYLEYAEVDAELFINNKSYDTLMEYEG